VTASVGMASTTLVPRARGPVPKRRSGHVRRQDGEQGPLRGLLHQHAFDNLERMQMEVDLRRALDQSEFQAYYQPIVTLPLGTIVGRGSVDSMESSQRGLVMPREFICVAESSG